jgi:hypothetical protein
MVEKISCGCLVDEDEKVYNTIQGFVCRNCAEGIDPQFLKKLEDHDDYE